MRNTVSTAGEATRGLNRKTQFELLFVLSPLVAVAIGAFAMLGFVADTSMRAGAAAIPFLLFVTMGVYSFFISIVIPFLPRIRRKLRIFSDELERHEALPPGVRHVAALFETITAPPSDPSNIVLAIASMLRGTVGSAGWFMAAWLYAQFVLGPTRLHALSRLTVADAIAFAALSLALRLGRPALRRVRDAYEPLEDIYAYADPSRKARLKRTEVVRQVTADLQSFLAATPFDAVVLTGHSLGSVLLLDALAEIERDIASDRYYFRHLDPVCAIVMYGSPFTKIQTQIRALDPRRFATEQLRAATAVRMLSRAAEIMGSAVCHNIYYLTDIVAEKIVTGDESIANYVLRSPLRPWSHGSYHGDPAFWSLVFDAAGLYALFLSQPAQAPAQNDAARFGVPSRWPAATGRDLARSFVKFGMYMCTLGVASAMLARGANVNLVLVFLVVVPTAIIFTIKD